MTNWGKRPAVESVPGGLSGAWVFTGTRVPVSARFENLENGAAKEQFLDWFGGVEEWKGQSRSRTCGEVPQSFCTTAQITERGPDPRDGRGIG